MFVSLRLGLFVRVVLVAAFIAGALMLVLSARTQPEATQPGPSAPTSENVRGSERPAVEVGYRVSGTGGAGLNLRACPDVDCVKVGRLDEGAAFVATCWQPGSDVSGNTMWLSGEVDGRAGFAAAHYLRPDTAAGAPACPDPAATLAR
ncbi:hypothetical protein [Qaidamihabitans albus]|uniref:hypothetical protein n=1 Tax=Qaidamihabitans albus TaxID=2795733 RepID=UPI0018F23CE2|nr:hypothetical protein [Qaidamihabitans albus]